MNAIPESSLTLCRKTVFAAITFSIFIFSIYGNSLDCSWHLDDITNITDNQGLHINELSVRNIKGAMFSDPGSTGSLYRPIACLSFALNYYFSELDVVGFHVVNIFIHILSAFLLYLFIRHTLNLPGLEIMYSARSHSIALLAAILWAVNPVQTQAVTYIVQRMSSLAGLFYIGAMFFYLRARVSHERARKTLFSALCIVSFALALGSKENAALLPLSLLLYEILVVQKGSMARPLKHRGKIFLVILGTLLLGLIYLYFKKGGILFFLSEYEGRPFTFGERLLTQTRVILYYISLLIYPMPERLSIAHSVRVSTSLLDPLSTLGSLLFIVGAIGWLVYISRKYPLVSFSYLFFFLNHVMESSIFALEMVFEHRNYIPSMFFFLPVAIGLFHLFDFYAKRKALKHVLTISVILLLIGFGHATFVRNFAWKSEQTLWVDASMKAPDQFRPHHNLGVYYQRQGRFQEAISEYEKALKSKGVSRKKEKVVTFYQLGRTYQQLGDLQKAKRFYEQALRTEANLPQALADLAVLYGAEGDAVTAFGYLERAVKADSENPYVNFNMGLHYMKNGEMERAEPHFRKAAVAEGIKGSALLYLGIICKQRRQLGRAVMHLKASAAANPKDATPHLHLLEVYHAAGLERLSLQEGEVLAEMTEHDETLLKQIVDRMVKKDAATVCLSGDVIIPILYQALTKRSDAFKSQLSCLKKLLDKGMEIE